MRTHGTTAALLDQAIRASGKTQREIANETGFARPNVVSMMKSGEMRVPIERIPAIAESTGIDPVLLLNTAMTEYMPEMWSAIRSVLKLHLPEEGASTATLSDRDPG
ncbi:helix-turn-helix transcriptional regulator [Puniceibacterium sediminis]|uniref:Helix-turn-helix n=1 Tax=Puniceibacterium sediminis TaxID=1608407 RepID=A0A238Z4J5_9RHOB|nr:helix-turn-helix transcriptional regulator [Puniceibacterium sediminis]SNR78297.1 hypothetical protein SAMN06265370_12422 [Puniceibacterium sediminis]